MRLNTSFIISGSFENSFLEDFIECRDSYCFLRIYTILILRLSGEMGIMKWKQLVTPVPGMEVDEAKDYISKRKEGTYTLLDVRQMGEYEKSRIPGARLIPLPELSDRLGEIDPKLPIIVY